MARDTRRKYVIRGKGTASAQRIQATPTDQQQFTRDNKEYVGTGGTLAHAYEYEPRTFWISKDKNGNDIAEMVTGGAGKAAYQNFGERFKFAIRDVLGGEYFLTTSATYGNAAMTFTENGISSAYSLYRRGVEVEFDTFPDLGILVDATLLTDQYTGNLPNYLFMGTAESAKYGGYCYAIHYINLRTLEILATIILEDELQMPEQIRPTMQVFNAPIFLKFLNKDKISVLFYATLDEGFKLFRVDISYSRKAPYLKLDKSTLREIPECFITKDYLVEVKDKRKVKLRYGFNPDSFYYVNWLINRKFLNKKSCVNINCNATGYSALFVKSSGDTSTEKVSHEYSPNGGYIPQQHTGDLYYPPMRDIVWYPAYSYKFEESRDDLNIVYLVEDYDEKNVKTNYYELKYTSKDETTINTHGAWVEASANINRNKQKYDNDYQLLIYGWHGNPPIDDFSDHKSIYSNNGSYAQLEDWHLHYELGFLLQRRIKTDYQNTNADYVVKQKNNDVSLLASDPVNGVFIFEITHTQTKHEFRKTKIKEPKLYPDFTKWLTLLFTVSEDTLTDKITPFLEGRFLSTAFQYAGGDIAGFNNIPTPTVPDSGNMGNFGYALWINGQWRTNKARIAVLEAKKLAGTITPEETEELNNTIEQNKHYKKIMQYLSIYDEFKKTEKTIKELVLIAGYNGNKSYRLHIEKQDSSDKNTPTEYWWRTPRQEMDINDTTQEVAGQNEALINATLHQSGNYSCDGHTWIASLRTNFDDEKAAVANVVCYYNKNGFYLSECKMQPIENYHYPCCLAEIMR